MRYNKNCWILGDETLLVHREVSLWMTYPPVTEWCFRKHQQTTIHRHSSNRRNASDTRRGQACSGNDPKQAAKLLIQNLQVRNTKLHRQVQGECRQGRCRDKPYCTSDSRTGHLRRLYDDLHRFLQQPKPAPEDFLFWGGQRSVINSSFLRWVALEQSDTPFHNLANISYTGILSVNLGVHIGVYQPWYSQSLFINSRYYYDEYSCVNIGNI